MVGNTLNTRAERTKLMPLRGRAGGREEEREGGRERGREGERERERRRGEKERV